LSGCPKDATDVKDQGFEHDLRGAREIDLFIHCPWTRLEVHMRKRVMSRSQRAASPLEQDWLNVEDLVELEITSEDADHPIEAALLPGVTQGWRAAEAGNQTIRLLFNHPQKLHRIWMNFVESETERTQEYVLRWSSDDGQSFHEIVRQQWHFSPPGTTNEMEDHQVELPPVTMLELSIIPDISGGNAFASLAQLRLA